MRVHVRLHARVHYRYLWMNLKRIVGSHFANYREAHEAKTA